MNARWTAVIEYLVHGGAHRSTRIENVIHQNDMTVLNLKRKLGRLDLGMQAYFTVIITIKRYIQHSQWRPEGQYLMDALGKPSTTCVNTYNDRITGYIWP